MKPSLPMTCCCRCSRTSRLCLSKGVFQLLKYKFQCNYVDQIVQVARASVLRVLRAFSCSVVLSSCYSPPFNKEEMQQEGLSKVLFSVSSFSFVINTYVYKRAFGIVYFYQHVSSFLEMGRRLSLTLTLSSHLANVCFFVPHVNSSVIEHVFLITSGYGLGCTAGFVADSWAQPPPQAHLRPGANRWDVELGGEGQPQRQKLDTTYPDSLLPAFRKKWRMHVRLKRG